MDAPNSGDLLRATRAGDTAALAVLLQQHLPGLRAHARLRMSPLLRAREDAEDIVQSACCALLQGLEAFEYRGEEAFRGWLYTAVYRKVLEHERDIRAQRRDARRAEALPSDSRVGLSPAAIYARMLSPSQELMAQERVQALEAAFDALPEHYREVLALSRIAQLSRAAIAEQLGKTEAAVKGLLMRALAELAFRLEREADGAPN